MAEIIRLTNFVSFFRLPQFKEELKSGAVPNIRKVSQEPVVARLFYPLIKYFYFKLY